MMNSKKFSWLFFLLTGILLVLFCVERNPIGLRFVVPATLMVGFVFSGIDVYKNRKVIDNGKNDGN